MNAPAGMCEWCGGPQQWTFVRSVMYVRCVSGCLPLLFEDLPPTIDLVGHEGTEVAGGYREASVGVGELGVLQNNPGRRPGSVHIAVDGPMNEVNGERG